MFKKTLAEQTVLKPGVDGTLDPGERPPDNLTPVMSVDIRRHKRAEKQARRIMANQIVGESKASRRLRRRNGG